MTTVDYTFEPLHGSIDPVTDFLDLGISEDDAYAYIAAGFWATEVRGYLDGGISSIEEMSNLTGAGIHGETFGALHRAGITDRRQIAHIASADEDWYTVHVCLRAGLSSYDELAYIVDNKIPSDIIAHAAEFSASFSTTDAARAFEDAAGLGERQRSEAITITQKVFGDSANALFCAHKYPHAIALALNKPVLAATLKELQILETERQQVIDRLLALSPEMFRKLAQLCEGQGDLDPQSIGFLADLIQGS